MGGEDDPRQDITLHALVAAMESTVNYTHVGTGCWSTSR